jgi:hypothetical protein
MTTAEDAGPPRARAPLPALLLGYAGLVPFAALAAGAVLAADPLRAWSSTALLAYGATILSFLGGLHWGLALAQPARVPRLGLRLGIGVAPQLLGWGALLAPPGVGHVMIAAALVAVLALDHFAAREGLGPAWLVHLRAPLSIAAAIAMAVAAGAT